MKHFYIYMEIYISWSGRRKTSLKLVKSYTKRYVSRIPLTVKEIVNKIPLVAERYDNKNSFFVRGQVPRNSSLRWLKQLKVYDILLRS